MFENKVLTRIFGPKRDEVTGEWRKLCTELDNDLYSTPNIIGVIKSRRMRGEARSTYGKIRGVYSVLVEKSKGKRPLGRPRRRWEDNKNMDLQEVGWSRKWIDLAQDRGQMVGTCKSGNEVLSCVKWGALLD